MKRIRWVLIVALCLVGHLLGCLHVTPDDEMQRGDFAVYFLQELDRRGEQLAKSGGVSSMPASWKITGEQIVVFGDYAANIDQLLLALLGQTNKVAMTDDSRRRNQSLSGEWESLYRLSRQRGVYLQYTHQVTYIMFLPDWRKFHKEAIRNKSGTSQ